MSARLAAEQAARLREAEREWLVASRVRLRRSVVRRLRPAGAGREEGAR